MLHYPVSWTRNIDTVMGRHKTFAEFLEQRNAAGRATDPSLAAMDAGWIDSPGEPEIGTDPTQPGRLVDRDKVFERSMFKGLFRGMFKAVNPSRPLSPTNSRLLSSPFRKWHKSQVMGK